MGKQSAPRKVGDKEALAVGNTIRGSARKLNLVAQMIRGRKVEEALNILKFSPKGMVIVRLNSGEQRYVRSDCMATVGAVSNPDNANQTFAKAGRTRWLGKRPLTRGVAKNPVDHPHGGGEGRTSGGRHPVTPWGKPTKGARTRHNKSTDKFIIRSRHAKKKG